MTEKETKEKAEEREAGRGVEEAPQDTDCNARFDDTPTGAQEDEKAAVRKEQENQNSTYLPHLGSYLSYLPTDPQEDEKAAIRKENENADTGYLPHLGSYLPYLPQDEKEAEKAAMQHNEKEHDEKGNHLSGPLSEAQHGAEEALDPGAAITDEDLHASNTHDLPQDELGIPPPLPTTNLRRGRNVPHQSQAGAFLANGRGTDLVPAGTMNGDISNELSLQSDSNHQRNGAVELDESGLARARLVSDEEDQHRVMATEHDARAIADKRKQFLRRWILVFLFFFVAVVCGIVVPVILLGKPAGKDLPNNNSIFDDQNQTNATIAPINLVVSGLPNYTIAAMENKESPQFQAYDWLLNDPNLDTLSEARKMQRFAMATFYFATGGGRKKWGLDFKWLEYDEHECDWFNNANAPPLSMQRCNTTEAASQDPYIQALSLGFNGLVGTIPRQLALLTGLRGLVLHENKLTGSVPEEIISLPRLEGLVLAYNQFAETPLENVFGAIKESLWYLDLAGNSFTGTIPTKLGHLTKLSVLDLYGIKANGSIPTELGLLSHLGYLDLVLGGVTGHIPTQVGRLTLLEELHYFGGNLGFLPSEVGMLSHLKSLGTCASEMFNATIGTLPSFLWRLTSLECLNLHAMSLSGTVPTQLLKFTHLHHLDLSENSFSGSIPVELGQLTALTYLDLGSNPGLSAPLSAMWGQMNALKHLILNNMDLSGQLPSQLFHATNLLTLSLSGNGLSGPVPTELGKLTALEALDLAYNMFRELPMQLWNLASLESIRLSGNHLLGSIPSELGQLSALTNLELRRVGLSGQIPTQLFALTNLIVLDLSYCLLSGSIPVELGQMTSLTFLNIRGNSFDGTIPKELFHGWKRMQFLRFEFNQLSGSLPTEIGTMPLKWLLTNDNQLSGHLPSEIGQMKELDIFTAANNAFSGSVPDQVWKLSRMVYLTLSRNQLSGTIWPNIGSNSPGLKEFRLYSNHFQGVIPSSLGLLENLYELTLQENFLDGTVPDSLGSLDNVRILDLDGNLLDGLVPSSLGMLTKLHHLSVGNQPLEGTLPTEVWKLPMLEQLSISNCNISGKIPSTGLSPKLNTLRIQGSHVTGVLPNVLCARDLLFNCSASLCGCTCLC